MTKKYKQKTFTALAVVCLSLSSPLLVTRNSWAQQSPEPEIASLIKQRKSREVQRLYVLDGLNNSLTFRKAKPEVVVKALIAALEDPSKKVRQRAISYLGNYLVNNQGEDILTSAQSSMNLSH